MKYANLKKQGKGYSLYAQGLLIERGTKKDCLSAAERFGYRITEEPLCVCGEFFEDCQCTERD